MAQRRLNRVGFGSFFFSREVRRVSGAFSTRRTCRFEPNTAVGGLKELPRRWAAAAAKRRPVYIIPYYRATPDICRVLCENLNDLRVHRFMGQEFRQFRQVVFLGTKIPAGKPPEWQNACLPTCSPRKTYRSWISFRKAPMSFRRRLSRWNSSKAINSNVAELAEQLKRSKTLDCLFENRTRQSGTAAASADEPVSNRSDREPAV